MYNKITVKKTLKLIFMNISFLGILLSSFVTQSNAATKTQKPKLIKENLFNTTEETTNQTLSWAIIILIVIVVIAIILKIKHVINRYKFKQAFGEEEYKNLHILQRFFLFSNNSQSWMIAEQNIQRQQGEAQTKAADAQTRQVEILEAKFNKDNPKDDDQTKE